MRLREPLESRDICRAIPVVAAVPGRLPAGELRAFILADDQAQRSRIEDCRLMIETASTGRDAEAADRRGRRNAMDCALWG